MYLKGFIESTRVDEFDLTRPN